MQLQTETAQPTSIGEILAAERWRDAALEDICPTKGRRVKATDQLLESYGPETAIWIDGAGTIDGLSNWDQPCDFWPTNKGEG